MYAGLSCRLVMLLMLPQNAFSSVPKDPEGFYCKGGCSQSYCKGKLFLNGMCLLATLAHRGLRTLGPVYPRSYPVDNEEHSSSACAQVEPLISYPQSGDK